MIDDDGQPPIENGQMDKPLPTVEEFRDGLLSLDSHNLLWLPDFGVGHLTIKKAAELVAFDMWYSGEITDIEAPENWDGSEHDPKLLALLAQHVATFEARLLNAVDSGKIKATAKRRDFDERLNPEKTYIKNKKLIDWLIERGYEPGDIRSAALGTRPGGAVDYARSTAELLAQLSPSAQLDIVGWQV